jgi:penicillin-binding protein 1A
MRAAHKKSLFKRFFPEAGTKKIFLRVLVYGFALCAGFVGVFFFFVWSGFFGKLPNRKELKEIQSPLASEVYSADSILLGKYFIQDRSFLRSEEIPQSLKSTLVATEDVRFYSHDGVDVRSLLRVMFKTILLQDESSGGGSTLTQQLAKNLYPRKSYGFLSLPINKTRELILASRLESVYSKDELLVLYLNTIPFADNTFGIKAAADRFFSTPVKSLSWDQSAVLVGMLKATHSYNPRLFPERAMQRRNVVLAQLAKYDFISEQEKTDLQAKPLGLRYNSANHNTGLAPYFRAYIQSEILEWCANNKKEDGSPYNLYKDGLKIYTTIDSRFQKYAERAMESQMRVLQKQFAGQIPKRQLDKITLEVVRKLPDYQKLKKDGLSDAEIIAKLKKPLRTKVFTWDGEREVNVSVYDSVKHHIQFLQAGLLAMNPIDGSILAYVGGINHKYFQYDHVRETTKRQIGSTFKPIVYAAALERGLDPCAYISARKTVYTNMDDWAPQNSDDDTYDKKYSMQGGLSGSVNTVSVKVIEKAGINNAISTARKMGITSDLPAVPSIALGTPSISVFEMVSAYSVFATYGTHAEPKYLLAITDRKGNVLQEYNDPVKRTRALSRETAEMMVHMLKSVVSDGTGSALRTRYGLTNDIAGKTGTTQSNVDGWFISISPKLVVGSWVGADDPRLRFSNTTLGQGASTALPIVAKFYQNANKDPELKKITYARFPALSERLESKLDCKPAKSNLNIFERIFKKKKKVKIAKFKGKKDKTSIP